MSALTRLVPNVGLNMEFYSIFTQVLLICVLSLQPTDIDIQLLACGQGKKRPEINRC